MEWIHEEGREPYVEAKEASNVSEQRCVEVSRLHTALEGDISNQHKLKRNRQRVYEQPVWRCCVAL